jgi:hypothetical protein
MELTAVGESLGQTLGNWDGSSVGEDDGIMEGAVS